MKQAGICFWMMIKRMGKHPVYWALLLLFPAAFFVVPKLNRAVEKEQILVGYVMEEAEDAQAEPGENQAEAELSGSAGEGFGEEEQQYRRQLFDSIEYKLDGERIEGTAETFLEQTTEPAEAAGTENIFQYIKYTAKDELKEDILTGKLSCGIVFHEDFTEKLRRQDYWHCITIYQPEGMNTGGMVQEDVFQRIYQAYSALWYTELLTQQGYQIQPEEVLQKFSEYQKEGKVFAVHYEVQGKKAEELQNAAGSGEGISSVLSLRGVLAFLTLLSASLGALDAGRDRKRGLGKGIPGHRSLDFIAAGAPILPASLLLAVCMLSAGRNMTQVSCLSAGNLADMSRILPELGSALLYGFVLWILAVFFSRILPEKLLEGMMPCFLLIVLICCPIFFNLGENIPLIGSISKLFPITWYLNFWG